LRNPATDGDDGDDDLDICSGGTVNTNQCTLRSNGGTTLHSGCLVNSDGSFCGGHLTNNSGTLNATNNQNNGTINDPYASNTTVQNALNNADSANGTGAINCTGSTNYRGTITSCTGPWGSVSCGYGYGNTCTIQPGTYTSLSADQNANVTLASGPHTYTGSCSVTNGSTVTGSGVTVLMAAATTSWHDTTPNTWTTDNTSTVSLTAATKSGCTNGQLAGISFASHSSGSCSLKGSDTTPSSGVIYYPNGKVTWSGSAASGSANCSQLIAKTASIRGTSNFDTSGCGSYGTTGFTSVATTVRACLIH
jgi:hypothetical protein